ncbi:hypothetical protein L596_023086 [Steinernema carpocapsae]|uniref:DUF38 domain-containing protein n=1 Tax=Steinernema carpocapsae TaxID=34508 RepID=A0A4U5MCU0_STECR|nr:hypothetical protein L596_023086 [Steinernema carpocapsae]
MDFVPFEFVEEVKTLLDKDLSLCGLWGTARKAAKKKPLSLHLYICNGSYQYTLSSGLCGVNLVPTTANNFEIRVFSVHEKTFSHGFSQLDLQAQKVLRHLISRAVKPIYLSIFTSDSDSLLQHLLEAVPRFAMIHSFQFLENEPWIFNAMKTSRVSSVDLGTINLTLETFYVLQAFTKNCNFKRMEVSFLSTSEVSYEEVFKAFRKRLRRMTGQGRHATLSHGLPSEKIGELGLRIYYERDYTSSLRISFYVQQP